MTDPQDHLEDSPEAAGSSLLVWLDIKSFYYSEGFANNHEWKYAE